jgi:hypothetical protein
LASACARRSSDSRLGNTSSGSGATPVPGAVPVSVFQTRLADGRGRRCDTIAAALSGRTSEAGALGGRPVMGADDSDALRERGGGGAPATRHQIPAFHARGL